MKPALSLLKRPPTLKMAPPGHHVVEKQARISKSGIKYFVKAHIRKNRGNKIVLLPENILYLFWHSDQEYPRLGKVTGYPEHPELDAVIQFWLNYWKEAGLPFPKDLDPFMIKVLIAVESRFKLRADPKVKHSTAFGLMQVTGTTRDDLKGKRKKDHVLLRDFYLDLEKEDLADAVVSIAAGIRWLSYKFTSIRNKQKNSFNMFRNYNSWTEGEPYAKKIMALYNSSRK
jgi:hypothetical protein